MNNCIVLWLCYALILFLVLRDSVLEILLYKTEARDRKEEFVPKLLRYTTISLTSVSLLIMDINNHHTLGVVGHSLLIVSSISHIILAVIFRRKMSESDHGFCLAFCYILFIVGITLSIVAIYH